MRLPETIFKVILISFFASALFAGDITLQTRSKKIGSDTAQKTTVKTEKVQWEANQTAVIICDMWNEHWCKGATARVAEMAPRMNDLVNAARNKGMLIVHAPSSCMDFYKDHPARIRAIKAPNAQNVPAKMGDWCHGIKDEPKELWPIDQSDEGCDDGPSCKQVSPWTRQIDLLEIKNQDIISDDGVEIWNVFEQVGIKNVILLGVHTNMCVIGRPFGLRNMVRVGKNVVLCRDLTDTMYNSRMKPYVLHFQGTDLVVDYIEEHICPTIVSTDLLGGKPFRFKNDDRKIY
jgi:nicotinamidase-related amidase